MKSIAQKPIIEKWGEHKKMAKKISGKLKRADNTGILPKGQLEKRARAISSCSRRIEFVRCMDCGSLHLAKTWLCRDRLCPICSWRLAIQRAAEMQKTLQYMRSGGTQLSCAMLTLTVRNCKPEALNETISAMTAAWQLMAKRRPVMKWVAGYARSIEVTYNRKAKTYHPHIHALLFWADGYNKHITTKVWAQLWAESLGVSYTPIVDIRSAYDADTTDKDEWAKGMSAAVEAIKYALKSDVAIQVPTEALAHLAHALKGRRLICYGGTVKAARAALKYDDGDTPRSVDETIIACPDCGATQVDLLTFEWSRNAYAIKNQMTTK